ncbi:MAG TPA: dephospho-CoA kinase [Bacteroidales bacterium]|nr:dephospho-CoA kinase [Bacteroidales bacterium]
MTEVNKPLLKLGVTGGIGSGKTSVCRVFSVLGIPVFTADIEAKDIMDNDREIIQNLNSIAGKDLYPEGRLDREELAKLIFNDQDLLHKVNSLVHPLIFGNFLQWVEKQNAPYVIMEAAILFESGGSEYVDKVVTVVAPVEERIERIVRGNKLTREQVLARIRNQMDDDLKIKQSDFVINNSENDMIIPAILDIHEDMINRVSLMK